MHAGTHPAIGESESARAVSPAASSDALRKRRTPRIGVVAFVRSLLTRLQPGIDTRPE